MKRFFLFCFVSLTFIGPIFTEEQLFGEKEVIVLEPVVVSYTRTPLPIEKSSGALSVLTDYNFSILNNYEVLQALEGQFGLDVVQQGGIGRQTSVFIRGANSGHTLVLFNNQRLNSPLTGTYDFADMLVEDLQQVEIVRGPMSTLYGSDAIGGVIQFIPKQGSGPFKATIKADAGSFSTFHEHVSVSQGLAKSDYYLSLGRTDSDGTGPDDDFESTYILLNTGFTPSENNEFRITGYFSQNKAGIDDFDALTYTTINDPNSTQERRVLLINSSWNIDLTEKWESIVRLGYFKEDLSFKDAENPLDPYLNIADFKSSIFSAQWQNNIALTEIDLLTCGIEYDVLNGENKGLFNQTLKEFALYASNQIDFSDSLSNVTGFRYDDNENFGSKWTGRSALNLEIPTIDARVYGSISTGFKAPTLNDLYFPGYGDPSLDPETSTGYELGLEKDLFNGAIELIVTGFFIDFDDLVGVANTTDPAYPFGAKAENIDTAESKGIEMELRYYPLENLAITLSYTFDKTQNKSTGTELMRRPENKGSVSAQWQPFEKLTIGMKLLYIGERMDIGEQMLEDYYTLDISAQYQLKENIKVYVRGTNILDEEYQETRGYDAPGAAAYGGVRMEF